ncbi:MAG: hypothetical protein M1832_000319 [Thelocarpon impressellum]|nr:MAG: hypothetical protein M1832_000319 [Thelocarpon impressellum]
MHFSTLYTSFACVALFASAMALPAGDSIEARGGGHGPWGHGPGRGPGHGKNKQAPQPANTSTTYETNQEGGNFINGYGNGFGKDGWCSNGCGYTRPVQKGANGEITDIYGNKCPTDGSYDPCKASD